MMTLSECLNGAADLIEQKGWKQREWGSGERGYCMIGAIKEVCPETYMVDRTHVVRQLGFSNIDWAIEWNDVPGRAKEEVVARLRLGATRAAVGGYPPT